MATGALSRTAASADSKAGGVRANEHRQHRTGYLQSSWRRPVQQPSELTARVHDNVEERLEARDKHPRESHLLNLPGAHPLGQFAVRWSM